MEEIKIAVEVDGEVEQADRLAIEDAVYDALVALQIKVNKVRVYF